MPTVGQIARSILKPKPVPAELESEAAAVVLTLKGRPFREQVRIPGSPLPLQCRSGRCATQPRWLCSARSGTRGSYPVSKSYVIIAKSAAPHWPQPWSNDPYWPFIIWDGPKLYQGTRYVMPRWEAEEWLRYFTPDRKAQIVDAKSADALLALLNG